MQIWHLWWWGVIFVAGYGLGTGDFSATLTGLTLAVGWPVHLAMGALPRFLGETQDSAPTSGGRLER